jgi:hypothetical protein
MSRKLTHYSKDPEIRSIVSKAMCLRLTEKETMDLLAKHHNNITFTRKTLYNIKKKIRRDISERFNNIIYGWEFLDEYLISIDTIKLAQKKMWESVEQEKDQHKRVDILSQIINTQPLLIEFYHNTKNVLSQHKTIRISQQKFLYKDKKDRIIRNIETDLKTQNIYI